MFIFTFQQEIYSCAIKYLELMRKLYFTNKCQLIKVNFEKEAEFRTPSSHMFHSNPGCRRCSSSWLFIFHTHTLGHKGVSYVVVDRSVSTFLLHKKGYHSEGPVSLRAFQFLHEEHIWKIHTPPLRGTCPVNWHSWRYWQLGMEAESKGTWVVQVVLFRSCDLGPMLGALHIWSHSTLMSIARGK